MRGKIKTIGVDQATSEAECAIRALTQVGRPIRYHLEYPNGGVDPDAFGPEDKETMQADCIALALWARGVDRYQPEKFPLYDGNINTDSMIDEALSTATWFRPLSVPRIGCFIVGHTYFSKLRMRNVVGHIGVVTGIQPSADLLSGLEIVHCSPYCYQFTNNASAVWKTNAEIWGRYPVMKFIEFVGGVAGGVVGGVGEAGK